MTNVDAFLAAISGTESGGDYEAYNESTGARGKYQFIPSTYAAYADDPDDWSPEQQELAAHRMAAEYIEKYGYRNAAIAWQGGEGAIGHEDRSDGNMTTGEYADATMARLQAIMAGDVIDNFVTPSGAYGMTHPFARPNLPEAQKVYGFWDEFYNKFMNQFVDQGSVSAVRTAWANFVNRDSMAEWAMSDYKPSQEDIELVQKGLEGDSIAQNYVLSNAHNRKTLLELLAMKQEDRDRANSVDNMDYGLSSVGSILGSVLDPTILLAFVPGLGVGTIAGIASKAAKVRALISLGGKVINEHRAAKIAANALTSMVYAGADRFAAQRWGGFTPDYATAMTFGGILGAIGGAISKSGGGEMARLLDNNKKRLEEETVRVAIGATPHMEAKPNAQAALAKDMMDDFAQEGTDIDLHYKERAAKAAAEKAELEREPDVAQEGASLAGDFQFRKDAVTPEQISGGKDFSKEVKQNENTTTGIPQQKPFETEAPISPTGAVENLNNAADVAYHDLVEPNSITDTLIKNGQLFILTEAKARKWAARYGVQLDPNAKAFSLPGLGVSVLIREKINKRNLTGVVMHEAGVHMALRNMIEPKLYDEILGIVKDRMEHSTDKEWIRATRKATSPEEALAYWIENMGNRKKRDSVVKRVRQGLEQWLDPNFDADKWIADTVAGALKRYAAKNKDVAKVVNMILDPAREVKSKQWAAAIKATGSTNPEIIFKHWITHKPNKNSALYKEIKRQAELAYESKELTDKEIEDFALKKYFHSDLYEDAPVVTSKNKNKKPTVEAVESNEHKEIKEEPKVFEDTENHAQERADNSQGSLVDSLMMRNAEETIHKNDPVQTLPDGSHIINGVTYSKNNVNGEGIAQTAEDIGEIDYSKEHKAQTIFDPVSDKGQSSKVRQGHFGRVGLFMEHGLFNGTIFGIMRNSHSRLLQMLSNILFRDPRMEASYIDHLPAESIKEMMLARWNNQYYAFVEKRMDYIKKNIGFFHSLMRNNCIKKVNEQIIQCYNAKARGDTLALKKFSPEIQSMANDLKELNNDILKQMQTRSENLGGRKGLGSLLAQMDTENTSREFFRVTDYTKLYEWMGRNYDDANDCLADLTEYARRFMDRDAETKYFIEMKKREFEAKKKTYKGKKPLQWSEPTEEEIEEHLEQAAKNWAYGRIDQNNSKLNFSLDDMNLKNPYTACADSLKHRLPVDTSGVMKLKNGVEFSFDKDLRSYDLDNFLPQIMNRLSGEIALRATIGDSKAQQEFYSKIAQEIIKNSPIRNGGRELEAMQMGLHKILGIGSYNVNEQKGWDAFSNMWRAATYANVGGNMTSAQLGELGGSIGYGGWKVLVNNIPGLRNLGKTLRLGKTGAEIVDNVTRKLWAEEIGIHGWSTSASTDSKIYGELFDKVSADNPVPSMIGRGLDATNRTIKRTALLTSSVNFMPKLTNCMVQSMRNAAIEDSLKWAEGKNMKGWFRRPFSDKKLAAAGIHTAEMAEKVRQATKKYLIDERGNLDHWLQEDPITFSKWKQLMDNESMRGIQQQSIGNMNPFREKHRLFFQFKDFTMKAMNQQFMRALSSHERDDGMAALYSYMTNTAAFYAWTVAKSYMYYPNDEQKRQEYMERNGNLQHVLLSGLFRMSMTAPLSFLADGWEIATGQSMYRTTVDNTRSKAEADRSWDKIALSAINQVPTAGTAKRVFNMGQSVKHFVSGDATNGDVDRFVQAFPLGSYLGMSYLGSMIKENTNLPDKRSDYTKGQQTPKTKKAKKAQKLGSVKAKTKTQSLLTSKPKAANKTQKLIDSNK
jgi:hypothetical protein